MAFVVAINSANGRERHLPGTGFRHRLRSGAWRSEDGNNQRIAGVESTVFATARWFPLVFALLQTLRHVGFIGYDYYRQNERVQVLDFLKRDLARPFFEPSGFCGAWTSYSPGQTADLGLDMPAYAAGTVLHSLVNWSLACDATLTTPRGQLLAAIFVMPVWFLAGLSIRRMSQRRWRRRAGRFWRLPLSFGLVVAAMLGFSMLVVSLGSVFVSGVGHALRAVGLAFWLLALAALCAERLRSRPFDRVDAKHSLAKLSIGKPLNHHCGR